MFFNENNAKEIPPSTKVAIITNVVPNIKGENKNLLFIDLAIKKIINLDKAKKPRGKEEKKSCTKPREKQLNPFKKNLLFLIAK